MGMAWSSPLEPNEVAIVYGRLFAGRDAPPRVVLSGRVASLPGERVRRVSLAIRSAEVATQCPSADRIPIDVKVRVSYHVPRGTEAVLQFCHCFPGEEPWEQVAAEVVSRVTGHVRAAVGSVSTDQLEVDTNVLRDQVRDDSAPDLEQLGLEVTAVSVIDIIPPPGYVAQKARQREMREQQVTAELDVELQDRLHRARAEREAEEHRTRERARVDADHYAEQRRTEIARDRMNLEAERLAMQRAHDRAMAEVEATRLRLELTAHGEHEQVALRKAIVERLPEILEARGKVLPGLRTYIAESGGRGLPELITGLAGFGLPIMDEVRKIFGDAAQDVLPEIEGGESEPPPALPPRGPTRRENLP
jgi:regulator of protease activity HflC (stomatin/prohibitin superfamily)